MDVFTNIDVADLTVATAVGAATGGLGALEGSFTKTAITGGKLVVNAWGESIKAVGDVNLDRKGNVEVNTIADSKSVLKAAVEFATGMLPTPDVSSSTVKAGVNAVTETVVGTQKSLIDEAINSLVKDKKEESNTNNHN